MRSKEGLATYPHRAPFSIHVDQVFESFRVSRQALIDAVINVGFELKFDKSAKTRVTARCAAIGCKWCIHASKIQQSEEFKVKTLTDCHTCQWLAHPTHRQAGSRCVASVVMPHLREHPKYKVKMIVSFIKQMYKVDINYMVAWRAKEKCISVIHGSWEESYAMIEDYMAQTLLANPGSITVVLCDERRYFKRCYLSYAACIKGFNRGCRPLLFINGTHAQGRYKGIILSATALYGDENFFPLAIAIVENESKDTWEWFFNFLEQSVRDHMAVELLTIISDCMKRLSDSVATYFPNAFHGNCAWHLCQNLQKKYAFDEELTKLEGINHAAAQWIKSNHPENWVVSKFRGLTYGHITSNIVESFNSWIYQARFLRLIPMLENIRLKLMTRFYDNHMKSFQLTGNLTPSAAEYMEKQSFESCNHKAYPANANLYEVYTAEGVQYKVDLQRRICSCQVWHIVGLPCSHALIAIYTAGENSYDHYQKFFGEEFYRQTYFETIYPILPSIETEYKKNDVLPPPVRRMPGRPKSKRRN
ncbi:uncharacterized protein LOC122643251 [Telopea speciosissima]|uniref:uncharacterized protein LOC122643251 n=1 Tax=Telopea speciosissima TaxID=54955 RepID=UPI001CC48F4F|nr:uncharacterized protein LOC122643251 [Telopea speciosissima]